jgi:hypothetical protein
MFDFGQGVLDARYLILDTGCWMLDAGCWMLDAGNVPRLPSRSRFGHLR